MATLGSPGVQVNVIDESFYTPSAPGTVPLIFVASRSNKSNAAATGTAKGTLPANVGNVYVITSQRDLTDTFGTPVFETDTSGNPVHGSEISEYGLQAAYSALGVSSRAYIVRADVDLGELSPRGTAPTGAPNAGQYWVDTTNTLFGVNEWDATTTKFTVKTVKVIDDNNFNTAADTNSGVPLSSFGSIGDYAMVVTSDNTNTLYYKRGDNTWIPVTDGFDGNKSLRISPHTSYPDFTGSGINASTGSVWVKTTTPGYGANWVIKLYNGTTKAWSRVTANIYDSTRQALEKLDYTGGGKNIPVGTLFIEYDYNHGVGADETASFKIWRRKATGATNVAITASSAKITASNSRFLIRETLASATDWSNQTEIIVPASSQNSVASMIPAAVSAAGLVNVTATYDPTSNTLTLSHALGGDFELIDDTNSPLTVAGFNTATSPNLYQAPGFEGYNFIATNWKPLSYEATASAPYTNPADGTLWFNSSYDVDIMYHNGTTWKGYRNVFPDTDPAGPLLKATKPADGDRSDGGSLVTGDIWIDTSDAEMYGKNIYVWDNSAKQWVQQDPTDNTSPNGWVFADARAGLDGYGSTSADAPTGTITDMLLSDFLDPDAPNPANYPRGTRLFNTRRSGNNVKKYVVGHIDITSNNGLNVRFQNDSMSSYNSDRWVTLHGVNADGSGRFGRHAQRGVVVEAFKSTIDTNTSVRDTDTVVFNLLACPGYTEAIANLINLNTDRGQTAFVVGDTPFRLEPTGTALTNWGSNANLVNDNGDDGAASYDEYMGMFYPSGFTTNNAGQDIVVPPSHMMLRTIINSDAKSYQWFAPAGTRRGTVDNATSVGYIDSTGEYKTVALHEGLRNVLHDVKINPIATLPGVGLVNFGQYTRSRSASALDRINVARLIGYLRRQLDILAKPFLFEPNDAQTRREIKAAADSLLLELVGQRALYDFITVCDSTNNTAARIDQNELWLDIAVEPVKAVEFIYIPLRIKNTGAIATGA